MTEEKENMHGKENAEKNAGSETGSEIAHPKGFEQKKKERTKCEVYSRVVGYIRPTKQWNDGKREEFKDRKVFKC